MRLGEGIDSGRVGVEKELSRMLHVPSSHLACGPLPQNRSMRPGPVMALPMSWLNTKRDAGRQAVISCGIQHWLLYLDERQSAWWEEVLVRGY